MRSKLYNFITNNTAILIIFLLMIAYFLYSKKILFEGLISGDTCEKRKSCSACTADHDSTGSICYWCKDFGCSNPDNYYDPSTCSSDKKCSITE